MAGATARTRVLIDFLQRVVRPVLSSRHDPAHSGKVVSQRANMRVASIARPTGRIAPFCRIFYSMALPNHPDATGET